jgi:hypothetical protein
MLPEGTSWSIVEPIPRGGSRYAPETEKYVDYVIHATTKRRQQHDLLLSNLTSTSSTNARRTSSWSCMAASSRGTRGSRTCLKKGTILDEQCGLSGGIKHYMRADEEIQMLNNAYKRPLA